MKVVATIKIKVQSTPELVQMSDTFLKAVRYALTRGFNAKISNRFKLHRLIYKDLRQWLPADFACCAIAKASEKLKLERMPNITSSPILFNRKLFTFTPTNVRIATFTKNSRQDIPIVVPEYYRKYLSWRYQTLEIVTDRQGRMFFHITFSKEVSPENSCGNEILGIDLGENNLAVCSDGRVFKGQKTKLMQFHYLRKRLQTKGTKSALRHLRKMSGRQKRYMRWVNHTVSKQIVSSADIFGLEDLKGIRNSRNRFMKGKARNRWLNSWSFYQLQSFISYKAEREGKRIVYVNPYMTSQTCSNCHKLGLRHSSSFVCNHCGFSSDADLNASYNLRRLIINQPNDSGYGSGSKTSP